MAKRTCTGCGGKGPFRIITRWINNDWREYVAARCKKCETAAGVERARRLRERRRNEATA